MPDYFHELATYITNLSKNDMETTDARQTAQTISWAAHAADMFKDLSSILEQLERDAT